LDLLSWIYFLSQALLFVASPGEDGAEPVGVSVDEALDVRDRLGDVVTGFARPL
jgi:hypothetical protein